MKTIIRVPTEQFAFVEQQFDEELEPNAVIEKYNALQRAYKGGEGMTDKEVDTWLDNMFLEKGNSTDVWAKRSPEQEKWLKCIKRSLSRIAAKQK